MSRWNDQYMTAEAERGRSDGRKAGLGYPDLSDFRSQVQIDLKGVADGNYRKLLDATFDGAKIDASHYIAAWVEGYAEAVDAKP